VKVGDLVKTTLWGSGVVLELKRYQMGLNSDRTAVCIAMVLVERVVGKTHIRRITEENLEVINESR
jgi:hypothetical protein